MTSHLAQSAKERGAAFSVRGRARSFRDAASGVGFMLRTQHNAWIHLASTVAVALVGWALRVSAADWRWLTVAVVLVWVAEAMNTSFEYLCDVVSPEFHTSVAKAKDIAAGAVLICACGALTLGALTLWPYLRGFIGT
jgi:diacylglycerol kinase (ATP)